MATPTLLVTGASGNLGRRVVELLLESKYAGRIIATTRNPAKLAELAARGVDVRAADFDDEASLAKAFAGAERALLVSTDALDVPGKRKAQQERAVAALEKAGAKHIVYTSCPLPDELLASVAPDHAATEAALRASSVEWTSLRNNLYADLFFATLPGAIASGQLIDAKANGKIAWVTREDCARVAAAALVSATGKSAVDVTGPEALDSDEIAAIVGQLAGKTITHISVTPEQLVEGMLAHGLPKPLAEVFASFDAAAAKGQLETVTDTVSKLTGRPPQSVRSFLSDARAALIKG
jgi:NAD(P)H dehydrogenase (quinone)